MTFIIFTSKCFDLRGDIHGNREDCVLEYPTGRTDTEFIKTIHAIHEKTDKLKQRIIKNQI